MRIRVPSGALRGAISGLAIVAAAIALSGCSSIGSRLLPSSDEAPIITGSTNAVGQSNLNQQMPSVLSPSGSSTGRYLPPADIGSQRNQMPIVTGSTVAGTQIGQGGVQSVRSQDLPALTPSRSTQSMPAQLSPKPIEVAATQPAPSVLPTPASNRPQTTAVAERPMLKAVPDDAFFHTIASGESLYTIARRYDVTTQSIVQANGMPSPDKIFVGQKVMIPGLKASSQPVSIDPVKTATVSEPVKPAVAEVKKPETQVAATTPVVEPVKPAATTSDKFRWPVSGTVISDFSTSKNGINIAVQEGTAVRSAESGQVIYVGNAVEGYGNLILIKHDNGYVSAYAHLKEITVAKGDMVGRGDAVGTAGMTGSVTRPQLHFELRKGAAPVDPMPLLAS